MNKAGRRWFPLFATNFLGVFNDNFLKMLVCFVGVTWLPKDNENMITALASAMLVVPYIILSPLAGKLSKLKNKQDIVKVAKLFEMPIMGLAVVGFAYQSIWILVFCIFLMGAQSALFSPAKYGLIRDVGGKDGLSFGTGTMEMLTFLGVILATLAAGLVLDYYNTVSWVKPVICMLLMLIAFVGWLTSKQIKVKESEVLDTCDDSINPIKFILESFLYARKVKGLNYIVLGLCGFWFIGAMLQLVLRSYCLNVLHLDGFFTSVVMTSSALGIGLGCYLAGVLSGHKVNLNLVLIGAIGIVFSFIILFLFQGNALFFGIIVFVTSFFSGLHEVPMNAWVQRNVKGRQLGDALAYINISTFTFISISALIYGLIDDSDKVGENGRIGYLFLIMAVVIVITTLSMYLNVPGMKKKQR